MSDLMAVIAHRALHDLDDVQVITIPWETRVKKRARVVRGHSYKEDDADERATAMILVNKWSGRPLEGPVALTIYAYRKDKRRSDIDNIAKHIMDAGNLVLWKDDSQIVSLHAVKLVDRQNPRTVVCVSSYPGET